MRFHEWITFHECATRRGLKNLAPIELCKTIIDNNRRPRCHNLSHVLCVLMGAMHELFWYKEKRAYFKIWPAITNALLSFPLTMRCDDVALVARTISLRFPIGREPVIGPEKDKMAVCLIRVPAVAMWDKDGVPVENFASIDPVGVAGLTIQTRVIEQDEPGLPDDRELRTTDGWSFLPFLKGATVEDALRGALLAHPLTEKWVRLAVAVMMLADDPSIITPDVLGKDRDRYNIETDEAWKQRAVERARRRGVVGWNIGADYEVCPHYRRPHFGLRYTGKGGTIPRIVPIKGAIVHRSKLTEVPTGYITPDGKEIESK